jgi:hypothetical protein
MTLATAKSVITQFGYTMVKDTVSPTEFHCKTGQPVSNVGDCASQENAINYVLQQFLAMGSDNVMHDV